jgi:hypothetical protein
MPAGQYCIGNCSTGFIGSPRAYCIVNQTTRELQYQVAGQCYVDGETCQLLPLGGGGLQNPHRQGAVRIAESISQTLRGATRALWTACRLCAVLPRRPQARQLGRVVSVPPLSLSAIALKVDALAPALTRARSTAVSANPSCRDLRCRDVAAGDTCTGARCVC